MDDLLFITRTKRGELNLRDEWIWATWNRKYYEKTRTCMELIPDIVVKKIARGVHDIPLWEEEHMQCFERIQDDVCCRLKPWMPKQSRIPQNNLPLPTLLLCKY